MSNRNLFLAFSGMLLSAVAAPQVRAAITLTDTGSTWYSSTGATSISNNFTCNAAANTLVVDLCWRSTGGDTPVTPPVVSYNGVDLTPAATAFSPSNPSVGANWTETGIYYLFNPPTGASDPLAVSITTTGSVTTYAVDAFTLGGVNTTLPPDQLAGLNTRSFWEGSGTTVPSATNTLSATLTGIVPGSWVAGSETYRATNGQPSTFTATGSGAYSAFNTMGPFNATSTPTFGNIFWAASTSDCLDSGTLVQNVTSPSLTVATSANVVSARMNLALAAFTPAGAPGFWTGATNANWSLNPGDTNWSGGLAYTDSTTAYFSDGGSAHPNVTIVGTVHPASVWFGNMTVPYSFSGGAIGGTGSVTIAGTGSVTFNNSNTYSGGTNVANGSLTANAANALGTGPVTVTGGALTIVGSNNFGSNAVNVSGGMATITSANVYSGGTNVTGGTLTSGNNSALGSGPLNVVTPGAVNFISATPSISGLTGNGSVVLGNASTSGATNLALNISGTTTISTAIAEASPGLGSVSKTGPGSLTLTGNNTYSGGTIISAGNLIATPSSLGTGSVHLNGGTFSPPAASLGLVANYYGPNIANFNSITSTSLANFNSTYVAGQTLAVSNNISANVVNGVSGNFDFDTIGEGALFPAPFNYGAPLNAGGTVAGTQVNDWAAAYTGYFYAPTTGTYTFGTNSDDNSRIWINNVDTALVVNGTSTGGQGWAGYGIVNATGTVSLVGGQLYPITVGYDEGGGGFGLEAFVALPGSTLTTGQAGTFIPLSDLYGGAPNYSNPLLVDNNSTLALSLLPGGASIPYTFPSLTIGANGPASLHVTGSGTSLLIAGATTLSGPSTFMLDAGVSVTLPQVGGTSGFTLSGNGLLNLSSATGNTYTGNTTVSGGTLVIANTSGSATGTGNVVVNGGVLSGPGIIVPGSGNSLTVGGGGALAPAPSTSSFGTLTVNGNASFSNGANLNLNFTGPAGTSTNDMISVLGNLSLSGSILVNPSFPNGLQIGTFPFISYTGTLTDTATFEFTNGALTATFSTANNEIEVTTAYNNATWTGANNGNWDTTTTGNWTQGTPYVNGNPGQPAIFPDISGNSSVVVQAAGVSPATVTFTNNSTSYSFSNASGGTAGISGSATTVTLNGSGSVAFNSPNTYGGGTFLNAGKLIVSNDNQLGTAPSSPATNLTFNGGILSFAGTTSPTINSNRSVVLNTNGGTFDVPQASNSVTVGGQISGAGGLNITGAGLVNLSGSNTYSGPTTVYGGVLAAQQASLGSANIQLAGGAFRPLPTIIPGLLEGWLNGSFDTTDPITASTVQPLSVQLSPRAANWTNSNGNSPITSVTVGNIPNNQTVMYQGYIYLDPSSGTVSFYKNFDDNMELTIDGQSIINNTQWNSLVTTAGATQGGVNGPSPAYFVVPSPGYYSFQLRLGQGGGGVGPNIGGYPYGFGFDPNGNGGTTASNYIFPTDPGNGSLFTTGGAQLNFANNVVLNNGSGTLDMTAAVGNTASFGGLTIGASGAATLHVTNGPATATFPTTTITNSPTFDVQGANVLNLGSVTATDTGGLVKTGAGTLNLTGSAAYRGPTTIQQGTVSASVASIGTGTINLAGGTFAPIGTTPQTPGLTAQYYTFAGVLNNAAQPANWTHLNTTSLSNFTGTYLSPTGSPPATLYLTDNITNDVVDGNFNFDYNNQEGSRFPGPFNQGSTLYWASKYTGYFYAPTTGVYTFATNSDDDSRIWINNVDTALVANGTNGQGWAGYGVVQNTTGQVSLVGGQYYPITIGYDEGNGGYGLEAFVALPGSTLTVGQQGTFLPVSDLFTGTLTATYSDVILSGNTTSAIQLSAGNAITFASLTSTATGVNTLEVTGGPGSAIFPSVTVANSPVFNAQAGNILQLNNVTGTSGFSATGGGSVVLTGQGSFSGAAVANGGNLVVIGPAPATGPLGSSPVTLNNGALILAATSTSPLSVDIISANPVTLAGTNDSIIAGLGGTSGLGVANGTVVLAGSNSLPIAAGQTLNLGVTDGYTMNFALTFSNSGTIAAGPGNITLQASNLAVPGTLSATSGGTLTMAGPISSGVYSPAAGGVVVLAGTYSGPLVNLRAQPQGILAIANNTSSGTLDVAGGGYVAINGNSSFGPATLELDGGTLASYPNSAVLPNALTWGAAATANFGGTATVELTAPLSLSSGTYTINDPNGVANLAGPISDAGTLVINGNPTLSGAISGTGAVTVNASPTLSGSSTYSGGTTFNPGANATITNSLALGTGTITFNNGGFQTTTPNAISTPWTIAANQAAVFSGTNAIQLSGNGALPAGNETIHIPNAATVTLSGPITGAGAMATNGGVLVLDNPTSTFSGGVSLQGSSGTIDVRGASTLPSGATGSGVTSGPLGIGGITLGSGSGPVALVNNGTVPSILGNQVNLVNNITFSSAAGLTLSGPVSLQGTINISVGGNSNIAITGPVSGVGLNLSSITGAGSLTLTNTNSYNGTTSITAGTLIAGDNAFSGFASVFGNATTPITIGGSSLPAALVAGGPLSLGYGVEIDLPVLVQATAGPTTLGDITAGDATLPNNGGGSYTGNGAAFNGQITINRNVTLSAVPGGSVAFSGGINDIVSGGTSSTGSGITAASAGNGNVSLANTNSYTGATTVASGQLTLDYSYLAPNNNGTLGGIVPPTSPLVLSGGTLAFTNNGTAGGINETIATTQVTGFGSTIVVNDPNSMGVQVNLGTITRSGGVLDLPVNTAAFTTNNQNVNGILGGYLTVNGYSDWAANDGSGNVIALSSYNTDDYSQAANNVDVTKGTAAISQLTGPTTVNSLRFNTSNIGNSGNLDLNGQTLTLNTGGILVTPNVGSGKLAIIDGSLTASGGTGNPGNDVVVVQGNATAPFTIGANITNNGSIAIGLTKGGPGALVLTGSNTFSGPITVSAGTLQLGDGTPGHDTLLNGNIANNGALLVNLNGNQTYGGTISGLGSLSKGGTGTLAMTAASTYGGATIITQGTVKLVGIATTTPPVAGYSYWFNAANLGLANGAQVTTLANGGSKGGVATAVSSSPPTYAANAINGLGAVLFSGQQGLLWPSEDSNIETVFSVFAGSSFLMTDSSNPGSGNYNFHRYQGDDNDANAPLWDIQTSNGWASGNITGGTTSVNGSIYYQNNASTIADMPVNASTNGFNLIAVQTTGPVTADSFNYDRGSPGNPGDHYAGNGGNGTQEQGEVIVYDTQLTTAQVQEVEAYLNAKWGLGIAGFPGSNNNLLPVTTPLTLASGATLDLAGGNQQVASLSDYTPGNGGSIINSNTAAASVFTISLTGATSTFSGSIGGGALGAVDLVKSGSGTQVVAGSILGSGSVLVDAGTLILSGTDSYTGGTTAAGGTLLITTASALPADQSLVIGGGGTFIFDPTATASAVSGLSSAAVASSGRDGIAAVPEPGTLALLAAAALLGCGVCWRRKRG